MIIRNILVATDFSTQAANAFRYAIQLANDLDARIKVVHAVYPEYEAVDVPMTTTTVMAQHINIAEKNIRKFIADGLTQVSLIRTMDKVPQIEECIEVGLPIKTILREAKDIEADLVVVGTRHEHSAMERFFGTVTHGIIEHATCAVMVVPEKNTYERIRKVAYASDFNKTDPFAIWNIEQMLEPFDLEVACVHIFQDPENEGDTTPDQIRLKDFFDNRDHNFVSITFHEMQSKDVASALGDFAKEVDADVIAMYSPKRNFFQRLFHKSVSKQLSLVCDRPTMVMK